MKIPISQIQFFFCLHIITRKFQAHFNEALKVKKLKVSSQALSVKSLKVSVKSFCSCKVI